MAKHREDKEIPFHGALFQKLFSNSSYIDILVYNLWSQNKVAEIPDALRDNFKGTLGFSTFLAGFQFIGLQLGDSGQDGSGLLQWSAFLLVIGLVLSSLSACFCLIVIEFLRFLEHEPPALILVAVSKYNFYVRWATKLSIVSLLLFITSVNTAAHAYEKLGFAIAVHVLSVAAVIFAIASSILINFRRQRFTMITEDGSRFDVRRSLYNFRERRKGPSSAEHAPQQVKQGVKNPDAPQQAEQDVENPKTPQQDVENAKTAQQAMWNPWADDDVMASKLLESAEGKHAAAAVTYGGWGALVSDVTGMFHTMRNWVQQCSTAIQSS